jgi:hypothetical protein
MTTQRRIEKMGRGGKYGVRVTAEGEGLRFAVTLPGKTHASSVLVPKDAKAIAQFITTAIAALLAVFVIAATPLAHADDTVNDLICTEMRMDLSADQIAQSVHFGDPTMPPFIVRGRVVNQLGDRGLVSPTP